MRSSGECALDHPAAAQDLEAALLVGAFDDFQLEGQPDELARELGSGIATVSKDLFQARIFLERPLDQTSGTVAILDISRNYLEREEVAFGVDEGIALNAFNFLARIVADRINGDPPCMGRFLSRGCPTGPINILRRSFFCEPGQPLPFVQSRLGWGTFSPGHFSSSTAPQAFPRPDRGALMPARAEAVKDGA